MNKTEARDRIGQLRKIIDVQRYAYHVLDKGELSDAALDSLKHELYQLEQQFPDLITADSPTQRVGGKALAKFAKVNHDVPMLSMEDVFTPEEFADWYARIGKSLGREAFDLFCMVKVDGLATSLIYEDGLLMTAATRGDGRVGENITENIKTVDAVPLSLRRPDSKEIDDFLARHRGAIDAASLRSFLKTRNGRFEVRGEVFMTEKAFKALNEAQKAKGEEPFSNPRNASAGGVRQLDSKITASRNLSYFAWDMVADLGQSTHAQEWELLAMLGFKVSHEAVKAKNVAEVAKFWKRTQERRADLGYWIDGTVLRVNDNSAFGGLGVIGKTPRGLVAWKFPAEEVTTLVEAVQWFVGRTGAVTPVAVLRPSWLGGTTVKHASLHNADEIERLDVMIGDTVVLYKAGDIIPKIKKVLPELRPKDAKAIRPPRNCPACGVPLTRREGEVAIVCANRDCPAKQVEFMANFVSKRCFDIEGLGYKLVEQLMEIGLVATPADIFRLKREDLVDLERFGEKSADNLLAAIADKKRVSLPRFIIAMGIANVGDETALDLARHFVTLAAFRKASMEDLLKVFGIGQVVAEAVSEWLEDKRNQKMTEDLLAAGVKVEKEMRPAQQPWQGMTFVFTGEMNQLTRDEAKERARQRGADVSESVSKNTTYVVAGPKAGSKLEKAQKLGVRVLNEEEFLAMLADVN